MNLRSRKRAASGAKSPRSKTPQRGLKINTTTPQKRGEATTIRSPKSPAQQQVLSCSGCLLLCCRLFSAPAYECPTSGCRADLLAPQMSCSYPPTQKAEIRTHAFTTVNPLCPPVQDVVVVLLCLRSHSHTYTISCLFALRHT